MWPKNRKIPVDKAIRAKAGIQLFGIETVPRLLSAPSILKNERGMALVMALIMGLVGMLITSSLLYMTTTGIWTSGSKARYQTALEASYAGLNFFDREIVQRAIQGDPLSVMGTYGGTFAPVSTDADFVTKLTTLGSLGIGAYPATTPDATLTMVFTPPAPDLIVNATVVSTSPGNSSTSPNTLVTGGVVSNNSGTITPMHVPYLYETVIQTQSASAPENARLSAIYAY